MRRNYFLLLLVGLFIFRLLYGLCSEFWFDDEIQIYLIGLKSYCTGTWPFYGPDVIYTQTQIPGALQGLLVSTPFYFSEIPESPAIFLNILSFISLGFLAYYICKRITGVPDWLVWILVLTTPWTLNYSTRVVNPSYVLVFSVPFFISILELLPIYTEKIIKPSWAFFIIGITTTLIMQLHMSYVLLFPYAGIAFAGIFKTERKKIIPYLSLYILGIIIGAATLFPTLISPDPKMQSVATNVVFDIENFKNFFAVLLRFLSFASYEIPYMMGAGPAEQMKLINSQIWMTPFAAVLLIVGFLQMILFVVLFFIRKENQEWKKITWLTIGSWLLIFFSFFFSVKGPSPHTFYGLLPIPIIYSFYCYQWLIEKKPKIVKFFKVMVVCGFFFHIGLGLYNLQTKSLYIKRDKVVEAISTKEYGLIGTRRAEALGKGY